MGVRLGDLRSARVVGTSRCDVPVAIPGDGMLFESRSAYVCSGIAPAGAMGKGRDGAAHRPYPGASAYVANRGGSLLPK
jgi:hypothetical protein